MATDIFTVIIVVCFFILGLILYKIQLREIWKQKAYLTLMTPVDMLKQALSNKFNGYMLCVDVAIQPRIRLDSQPIVQYLKERNIPLLLVHGPDVFREDWQLLFDMNINSTPALILIRDGVHLTNPIYLHDSGSFRQHCMQYIEQTRDSIRHLMINADTPAMNQERI